MNSFIECQNNPTEFNVLDHSQDEQYGQGINSESKVINCHTSSITTPNNKAEAINTEVRILPGFFTRATETVQLCYQALDYQSNSNCTCREMWRNTKQSKRNHIMQSITYEQNQVMTKDLSSKRKNRSINSHADNLSLTNALGPRLQLLYCMKAWAE